MTSVDDDPQGNQFICTGLPCLHAHLDSRARPITYIEGRAK